jgi:hypothetical protein
MQVPAARAGRLPRPIPPGRRTSRVVRNARCPPWRRPAPKAKPSHRLSIAMTEVAATSPFPAQTTPLPIPKSASRSATDARFLRLVRPGIKKVHRTTGCPPGGSSVRQAPTPKLDGNFRRRLCESGIRRVGASACRGTGALSRPCTRRSSTNTRAHGPT